MLPPLKASKFSLSNSGRPLTACGRQRAASPTISILTGSSYTGVEKLPLHPHNAVLQLWLELGAVGAVIGAAIAIVALLHATSPAHGRGTRIGMTAATAAALTVAATAYGIWQGWWMSALWLIAALARASEMPERA